MIKLFDRLETNFDHNKMILNPISCYVIEEKNGMFELEMELPKKTVLEGQLIKAPTPRGEQLFRVYRVVKSLIGYKVYAKHIFYDLGNNFIVFSETVDGNAQTAITNTLSDTESTNLFTTTSNITKLESVSFERVSPLEAIMSVENSILATYGGYLVRDGYYINLMSNGINRGYSVALGKNLIGIECDQDESEIRTRLYPIARIGEIIYTLPEEYIDSPLIGTYGTIISNIEVELPEDILPVTQTIHDYIRAYCQHLFEVGIDKPIINYKVDFIELSKTEQYKHLAMLEELHLYDIVKVHVPELNIDINAMVIKYRYDCLKKRYGSIELGDFRATTNYESDSIIRRINAETRRAIKADAELKIEIKLTEEGILAHVGETYATMVDGSFSITRTGGGTIELNPTVGFLIKNNSGVTTMSIDTNGNAVYDGVISAEQITAGVLSGDRVEGGTIWGSNIQWGSGTSLAELSETAAGTPRLFGYRDVILEAYRSVLIYGDTTVSIQGPRLNISSDDVFINCPITIQAGGDWSYLRSITTHHIDDYTAGAHDIGSTQYYFRDLYVKYEPTIMSDASMKENIIPLDDISWLKNMNVYTFNLIGDDRPQIGIIADEHVGTDYGKYFMREKNTEEDKLMVQYGNITIAMLKYIQEVERRVTELELSELFREVV